MDIQHTVYFAKNDGLIEQFLNDPNYRISPDGRVFTLRTRWGHLGKVWREYQVVFTPRGCGRVQYATKDGRKNLQYQRLIYAKLVGPLSPDKVVIHLDGDARNNSPSNLRLVTLAEKWARDIRNLKGFTSIPNRVLSDEQVREIRVLRAEGWTNRMLREWFKVSKSTVNNVLSGRTFRSVV